MSGEKKKNIHEGHRRRLKERFLLSGMGDFNEINTLEFLLFFAIPQGDVNPLAHDLLERFHSIDGVFHASQEELCEVKGVKTHTAIFLRAVPQIVKRSMELRAQQLKFINNSEDAGDYLVPRFMYEEDEVVLLLCLDAKRQVISCTEMGRGVVNSVETSVRRMVETALKCKASFVILAHNHPDGVALPSAEDNAVTRQLAAAFRLVGIQLTDHIIVAGEDYVSYRDSGLIGMLGI